MRLGRWRYARAALAGKQRERKTNATRHSGSREPKSTQTMAGTGLTSVVAGDMTGSSRHDAARVFSFRFSVFSRTGALPRRGEEREGEGRKSGKRKAESGERRAEGGGERRECELRFRCSIVRLRTDNGQRTTDDGQRTKRWIPAFAGMTFEPPSNFIVRLHRETTPSRGARGDSQSAIRNPQSPTPSFQSSSAPS